LRRGLKREEADMNVHDIAGRPVPGLAAALSHGPAAPAQGLVALPWFPFEVTSSAGCRAGAARLARRAERAYWLLRQTLDIAPTLRLRVLDRAAWRRYAEADEFGVMHVNAAGDLVVGAEPADAWTGVSAWLADHLDADTRTQLVRIHGADPRTRGPALGPLAEALIAHEIGHLFAAAADVRFPARWLAEAFANYAMVAVLGETDPIGLRRLGSLADAAATLRAHTPSLAQFDAEFGRMDVVPSVLAQLALTRGVYQTYAAAQAAPLARLATLFGPAARALDASMTHTVGLRQHLALHAHATLAAIPDLFPAAPFRAAA
jgi:hypothetical protein